MDRAVFWDFDGTLAQRDGMWSGCLLECLAEVTGRAVTLTVGPGGLRDAVRTILR